MDDVIPCSDESSPKPRQSHCSFCGHPGSKTAHSKFSCEYCVTANSVGCLKKSQRFQCNCLSCDKVHFLSCLFSFVTIITTSQHIDMLNCCLGFLYHVLCL